jgi:hypothetical protein
MELANVGSLAPSRSADRIEALRKIARDQVIEAKGTRARCCDLQKHEAEQDRRVAAVENRVKACRGVDEPTRHLALKVRVCGLSR